MTITFEAPLKFELKPSSACPSGRLGPPEPAPLPSATVAVAWRSSPLPPPLLSPLEGPIRGADANEDDDDDDVDCCSAPCPLPKLRDGHSLWWSAAAATAEEGACGSVASGEAKLFRLLLLPLMWLPLLPLLLLWLLRRLPVVAGAFGRPEGLRCGPLLLKEEGVGVSIDFFCASLDWDLERVDGPCKAGQKRGAIQDRNTKGAIRFERQGRWSRIIKAAPVFMLH